MHAIIDDQSNQSLATHEFFGLLNIDGPEVKYTLTTCSGRMVTAGRRAKDLIIRSIHDGTEYELPILIECDYIPHNRNEIPSPETVMYHPHLKDLAGFIPPIDENCEILLLIGRNVPLSHHILDQRLGSQNAPYAQKLNLGWVVIGETCVDRQHVSSDVDVKRTFILPDGRPTTIQPCPNRIHLREHHNGPVSE